MESDRMLWSVAETIGGYMLPSGPRMKISTFWAPQCHFLDPSPHSSKVPLYQLTTLPSRTTSMEKAAVQVSLAVRVAGAAPGGDPGTRGGLTFYSCSQI